ncbi:hypothetical protein DCO58_08285 [Helicobacter saguini]|uniref:Uncharacterized protein n=1 Tax=Helicobacter saguini TaxID=1548018 RepID=A0A347VNQ4_9HELI|nr:hypothetical protein [Helicobacter saguini]MWV61677.1 hypothetical protein [Helicobacter saguini]MWV67650.1 hypothetical protein [Helicobacter saguini]MWV70002.1 hypothetical protein [Helicobacter saguini]MWV72784.1 hypothetical protein [Helicobacter saguini]TLD92704.1 hypothetical protein LS64_009780 [Helicobacter saguini]
MSANINVNVEDSIKSAASDFSAIRQENASEKPTLSKKQNVDNTLNSLDRENVIKALNSLDKDNVMKVAFGISFVAFCLAIALVGSLHLGW